MWKESELKIVFKNINCCEMWIDSEFLLMGLKIEEKEQLLKVSKILLVCYSNRNFTEGKWI